MERDIRLVAVAAAVAAGLSQASDAGLVGTTCAMSFYGTNGSDLQPRTFFVSALLAEYYYSQPLLPTWGAFQADVRDLSLVVSLDFDSVASPDGIFFASPTRITLSIPETLQFSGFSLGAASGITNLEFSDLSGVGTRTLTINTSAVAAATPGSFFTIDFTLTPVPAPSALAAFGACSVFVNRRRRC